MSDVAVPRTSWPSWLLWLVWGLFTVAWSAALLRPEPAVLAVHMLPEEVRFPAAKLLHVGAYLVLMVLTVWLPLFRPPDGSAGQGRGWLWVLLAFPSLHAAVTE